MVFDGELLIGIPQQVNVSMTLTFKPVTLNINLISLLSDYSKNSSEFPFQSLQRFRNYLVHEIFVAVTL